MAAEPQPFDVSLYSEDVRASSTKCRRIDVALEHTGVDIDEFTARVGLWRGGKRLDTLYFQDEGNSSLLYEDYLWCPYIDGPGTFTWGPTRVTWAGASQNWAEEGRSYKRGSFTDSSTVAFVAKQDQRAKLLRATKSRGRITLSAKFRYFDIGTARWERSPGGSGVALQRKTKKGWKKLGAGKIDASGVVTVTGAAASGKATYRLLQRGTERTWSATVQAKR
ncbi:hypothetical protein [Nocardioides yefusunii]|nr:hypothetical protein [Nocardioides yefusunii]